MNQDGVEPLGAILIGALITIKLRLRLQAQVSLLLRERLSPIIIQDGDVYPGMTIVGALMFRM